MLKKYLKQLKESLPSRHSLSPLGYVRVNIKYPISFVLANIGHHRLKLAGHSVKMWSKRYENFAVNGTQCVHCGVKGKYFRLECNGSDHLGGRNNWHFNLYALDKEGNEVLMTKDHIIPKSKGGSNGIRNLQPMCCHCNSKKSDVLNPWDIEEGEFKK